MLNSPGLQSLPVRVLIATQQAFANIKGHGAFSHRDTQPTPSVAKYAERQEAF